MDNLYNLDYLDNNNNNNNDNDNNNDNNDNNDNNNKTEINKQYNNFDENLIPQNSIINNYNEKFYEILLNISNIKYELNINLENINKYIIKPSKIKLDKYEISYQCFNSLCYIINKKWCTNQTLTRLILADIYLINVFKWDAVYDGTWNEELQNLGI